MQPMRIGILLATAIALQVISMSELKYALGKEPKVKPPPQLAEATIDSWQKAGAYFRDSKSFQRFFPPTDPKFSGGFVFADSARNIDFASLPQPSKEFGLRLDAGWLEAKHIRDLSRFDSLTYIQLVCGHENETSLDDEALAELGKCKNLKSLVVSHSQFGDISFAAIAKLPQLANLGVYKANVTDEGFASTSGFPNLLRLKVGWLRISNRGLRQICTIRNLQELTVGGGRFDDRGLTNSSRLVNLQKLEIVHPISRTSMQLICSIASLQELSVVCNNQFSNGLANIHQLKKLERLTFSRGSVSSKDIDRLTTLPRLQTLSFGSIFGKSGLDENACASIAKLENLKVLSLGLLQTDDAIAPICSMDNLEELDCSNSFNVSDFGLTNLDQMKSLRKLSLANTKISNSTALRRLVKMPQLKTLDLSGTWINDRSVKPLGTMKSLRELDISSTDITPQGSLKLEFKLPDTKVISSHNE